MQEPAVGKANLAIYLFLALIVVVSTIGFVSAYVSDRRIISDQVSSAVLKVQCNGCQGNPNQFAGSYTVNFLGPEIVKGNGSQSYVLIRNSTVGAWTISWNFAKTGVPGSLEVTLVLGNGTVAFSNSTSAQYGYVSGYWMGSTG